MRVLITGMCGFVGHHVAELLLNETNWELVGLDRIDATSTNHRLRHIHDWPEVASRVTFVWHDLRAPLNSTVDQQLGDVDAVLHLAASSHVDRSIKEPGMFVQDNVFGTFNLLEWWRGRHPHGQTEKLLVQFGTDEVFGPAEPDYSFKEWDRYRSSNPYSASKAGAEELACAYSNTYGLAITAVHGMNIFGERQHPEKFIPMILRRMLNRETIPLHGDPETGKTGSRFYLHAQNVGDALLWLLRRGPIPIQDAESHRWFDKWNIVGEREVSNREMVELLAPYAAIRGFADASPRIVVVDHRTARPGYDQRYALDGSKLKMAGFKYKWTFEESLERTARWFINNPAWLKVD